MGKAYLSQFNMRDFKGAENINIQIGYQPSDYIADLATVNSNNIYLYQDAPNQHNYTISTEDVNDDTLYLNSNISSICMGLTNLQHTDLINKQKVNYNLVTNLHTSFANCFRLAGAPISSKYTQSMYGTFYNCSNLVGAPQVNENVNNLIGTFYRCQNITGQPNMNSNVRMAIGTYYQCDNLIGSPAPEVPAVSIARMYYGCDNLAGSPSNINNALVTSMAYYDCPNMYGTFYWDVDGIDQASAVNAYAMFYNRNTSNYLNIYVRYNQCILNALVNYPSTFGAIYETPLTWTEHTDVNGYPYYINETYKTNIYCDYNQININTFDLNEYALEADTELLSTEYIDGYTMQCRRNYGMNIYIPRWNGFIDDTLSQYYKKISLNDTYGINLYYVSTFNNSIPCQISLNDGYERNIYHDGNYYEPNFKINTVNIYLLDMYISTSGYSLKNLYFVGENYYNLIMGLSSKFHNDNVLSDLQFINIAHQTKYSKLDGILAENLLYYPLEEQNTLNMYNSFNKSFKSLYVSAENIDNVIRPNIQSALESITYRNEFYTSNAIINLFDNNYYLTYNGYPTFYQYFNYIAICGDNVVNLRSTYYNCYIYNDAKCGENVVDMRYAYYNSNINGNAACGSNVKYMDYAYYNSIINGNIYCGNNVTSMDSAYKQATTKDNITKCGENVIRFASAYDSYRCMIDGVSQEITININSNVQNADYAYNNTRINIDNIIFTPNLAYARHLYSNCKGDPKPLPALIVPTHLNYLEGCFDITSNITDISNFTMTHNVYNMDYCFRLLRYITEPIDLRGYHVNSTKGMYRDCYNLSNIGEISNIDYEVSDMFYGCTNLNWENFAKQNDLVFNCYYANYCFTGIRSTELDFDLNFTFNKKVTLETFLTNLNTSANIRITPLMGTYPITEFFYGVTADNFYFNGGTNVLHNDYYWDNTGSSFFGNWMRICHFNKIISNVPFIISHNHVWEANCTSLFSDSYIGEFCNIYFNTIGSNSFDLLEGVNQINCTNNFYFNSINSYYNKYCWGNKATSVDTFFFKTIGEQQGGQDFYSRFRNLHFNFEVSRNCDANFNENFIIDFTQYDATTMSGFSDDPNVYLNIYGYINNLNWGKSSRPYVFDVIGDKSDMLANIYLNLNIYENFTANNIRFRYSDSFINMNYIFHIAAQQYHYWFRDTSGSILWYNRKASNMYSIFDSQQDNYLTKLILDMGILTQCPNYLFEVRSSSFALPNLTDITINMQSALTNTGLVDDNPIMFGTKHITTQSVLNSFNLFQNVASYTNGYLISSINNFNSLKYILGTNSDFQSINTFLGTSCYYYNFNQTSHQA